MKVIFLNIDGVLNTGDNIKGLFELWKSRNPGVGELSAEDAAKMKDGIYMDKYGELFDERSTRWLEYIIKRTEAHICIISNWRLDTDMKTLWADRKLAGEVIGGTPNINHQYPAQEIEKWLEDQKDIFSYVIIDASDNYPVTFKDRLVAVNNYFGLTFPAAEAAIRMLETQLLKVDSIEKKKMNFNFNVGEM